MYVCVCVCDTSSVLGIVPQNQKKKAPMFPVWVANNHNSCCKGKNKRPFYYAERIRDGSEKKRLKPLKISVVCLLLMFSVFSFAAEIKKKNNNNNNSNNHRSRAELSLFLLHSYSVFLIFFIIQKAAIEAHVHTYINTHTETHTHNNEGSFLVILFTSCPPFSCMQ